MTQAGRLRRVAVVVGSPSGAWLAGRMLFWALALPGLKRRTPLERLLPLMWTAPRRGRDSDLERRVIRLSHMVHRAVRLGREDNCLERSLLVYRYLSLVGADPLVSVGARLTDDALEGHVWVTVDGEPVHDETAEVASYTTVTVFGAGGRIVARR